MSDDDFDYYTKRAAEERSRVSNALTPEIGAIHENLAGMYEALIERLENSPAGQDLESLPRTAPRPQPNTPQ